LWTSIDAADIGTIQVYRVGNTKHNKKSITYWSRNYDVITDILGNRHKYNYTMFVWGIQQYKGELCRKGMLYGILLLLICVLIVYLWMIRCSELYRAHLFNPHACLVRPHGVDCQLRLRLYILSKYWRHAFFPSTCFVFKWEQNRDDTCYVIIYDLLVLPSPKRTVVHHVCSVYFMLFKFVVWIVALKRVISTTKQNSTSQFHRIPVTLLTPT
jgi:hypothetical protein